MNTKTTIVVVLVSLLVSLFTTIISARFISPKLASLWPNTSTAADGNPTYSGGGTKPPPFPVSQKGEQRRAAACAQLGGQWIFLPAYYAEWAYDGNHCQMPDGSYLF